MVRIEVLITDDCPHGEAALDLIGRIAAELGLTPNVQVISVRTAAAAQRLRFLGSPTIRVDGADIEPGAAERTSYGLACRRYDTGCGVRAVPDAGWLRQALSRHGAA